MKKINLKGISEILSEKDLKNVIGGTVFQKADKDGGSNGTGTTSKPCDAKKLGDLCTFTNPNGYKKTGKCEYIPFVAGLTCVAREYQA
jgi:natural product precursor